MRIDDRVFIVTGASSGIGLATARALAARGGKVALVARSTRALEDLATTLSGSLAVTADMTDFDGIRRVVADIHRHYGRIDGLINNAGRSYAASVEEIDPALFDEIFHLNVLGPIVAMQSVIPVPRRQGCGSIVNINSGTAFMTIPQYGVYSKRAPLGFSPPPGRSWLREGTSPARSTPTLRRPTSARIGWATRSAAARAPITATATRSSSCEIVLKAIEEGAAQYFANDRLRQLAGA
jgi:hypothetical protein